MSEPTTAAAGGSGTYTKEEAAAAEQQQQQQQEEEDDGGEEYRRMAEQMKEEGNAAFKARKYKEAIDLYTRGLQVDPDNHVIYSNRSAAYLKENERGKALKDAERLMELKPDWPKSFSRKGAAQHALTRYTAAMETYEAGLRLFPEDKALLDGRKAAEEAYELDKQQRFEVARKEREAQEKAKQHQEALKKQAAELRKEAATAGDSKEDGAAGGAPGDELASFFSEVGGGGGAMSGANVQREVVKVVKEDYAKQDLGSSNAQIARLLQSNYQWKNLNPFEVLQLGTDATDDDVKMRYRKLSTLVHPDKCLENVEQAREAFEEVKKAYTQLMDEERRAWCVLTINETRKRTLKERRQKLAKGVTAAQLGGPEEEAVKKAIMKEFAEVEMRKRNAEKHQQAYRQFEQQKEDEEKRKLQQELEFDKKWTDETRREGRVGNWRDFQKGPGAKRARIQAYAVEENVSDKKHGQHQKEEWRKKWK